MKKEPFSLDELIYPIWRWWLLAWGLGLITALSVLGLLMTSGWFITMSAWAGLLAAGSHSFNYLAPSAMIRTLAISRTVSRYGDLMVSHQAIFELLKQLRVRFFYQFASLSSHERSLLGSVLAQHRLVKDIDVLDEFVLRFVSPWLIAWLAVLAFAVVLAIKMASWLFFVACLPLILVMAYLFSLQKNAIKARQLAEQQKITLLNALPAMTQLLLWQQWQHQSYNQDVAQKLADYQLTEQKTKHLAMLLLQWSVMAVMLVVLAFGVSLVAQGQLAVAWLLALVLGFFALLEVVSPILAEPLAYARSQDAKHRLNALLQKNKQTKTPLPAMSSFDLQGVQLSAKQPNAVLGLRRVDFVAKWGVPLVITGVSGGGKSTLLDVLAGEILPLSGSLQLCGHDGKVLDWQTLDWNANGKSELGFLGQRVDIFDQSLADNLRLGKQNASDDELWQVLAKVGLDDWAKAQPQGLNTALGEYGLAISGGQARRIALARLLLSPKQVLLLDEPFAGLDKATRQRVWQMLKEQQKSGLLIVVSHHDDILGDDVSQLVIGEPQS